MTTAPPLRLFVSFSPKDAPLLEMLLNHLTPLVKSGVFTIWSRASLHAGERIEPTERFELDRAEVVVPLLSADYVSSDRMQHIVRASERGCLVIPLLGRPCAYDDDPLLRGLVPLPRDGAGRPYAVVRNTHTLHDEPLAAVAEQLKESVRQLQEESQRQLLGFIPPPPTVRQSLPVDSAGATSGPWSTGAYVLVPAAPSRPTKRRRTALSWIVAALALLASIAVIVLAVIGSQGVTASLSSHPLSTGTTPETPRSAATAPPTGEPRCCGGVDCKPPAKDIRKTYCEKTSDQCTYCKYSGRRYIGGSCNAALARDREFLLRVSYASLPGLKPDEMCVRLSGAGSYSCTVLDAKSVDPARALRIPVRVSDISRGGRGIDIELRSNGASIASTSAATIDGLSAAMLCVGLSFAVDSGKAVFFLDDP